MRSAHALAIRDHFLAWQCRQRQISVRHEGGRPTNAMRPLVLIDGKSLTQIVVVFNKRESDTVTLEFRYMVLKTQDPVDRYSAALRNLLKLTINIHMNSQIA